MTHTKSKNKTNAINKVYFCTDKVISSIVLGTRAVGVTFEQSDI